MKNLFTFVGFKKRQHFYSSFLFIMKKPGLFLMPLFITMVLNSFSQTSSPLGTWNSLGVPNYLTTSDVISASDLSAITSALPESVNNSGKVDVNQFANLNLVDTTQVWVTFVSEGACWTNALGFYTYTTGNPPATVGAITNKTLIFPNVSDVAQYCSYQGSPGLSAGMKVFLGEFPSNTTIGWYLVAQGWKTSGAQVTNTYYTHYSNHNLNSATLAVNKPQNVFFYSSGLGKYILGFEDYIRPNGDNDFNDCVFYVTTIKKETGQPLPPPEGVPEIDDGEAAHLPVNFLDFEASQKDNGVLISWRTASEENNNRFEIQASEDVLHFITIGKIDGANNSNIVLNYSFMDLKHHLYYRIKQVDNDGKSTYSKIISLIKSNSSNISSIKIFPNPSSKNLISLQANGFTGVSELTIYNALGEIVLKEKFEETNSNVTYQIDISELKEGIYTFKFSDSFNQRMQKFVKYSSGF